MTKDDMQIEVVRSAFRLAAMVFLIYGIVHFSVGMGVRLTVGTLSAVPGKDAAIWMASKLAVIIEYVSFCLKDDAKKLVKNFLAHIVTGVVLGFGYYGAYALFDLKKKYHWELGAILHSTVKQCVTETVILSLVGLVLSIIIYSVNKNRRGY